MIDDVDTKILTILQSEGRTSNAEISRQVGMVSSAVYERIKKLEERGVIAGYSARVQPSAVELRLLAFVFLRADEEVGSVQVGERLARIPEVLEVHHIAGEDGYLVKVRAQDTETLGRLLRDSFGAIPGVRSTRTTVVLQTVKESLALPLAARK
jgi:Lrp/AsnC family transcriptional regulator, leucine-responsive regulatory protein